MIGYFGDIVFETSDSRILNFTGFKLDASARYATHEVIGQKPVTEYIGPNSQSVSFTISLNGNHGVKPREMLERMRNMVETGMADFLVIGSIPLGADRWVAKSVSEAWDTIFNGGELFAAKVDVSLEEYISGGEMGGY